MSFEEFQDGRYGGHFKVAAMVAILDIGTE